MIKRFLQFSLALNVALLVIVGWRSTRETPMPRTPRSEIRQASPRLANPRARSSARRDQPASPWEAIEDKDPRTFIQKLRAIGCPEQTIRDIVTLRVCRAYRNRLLEAEAEVARAWDYTRQQSRDYWLEYNERLQDLRDEMITTLESVMGQSWRTLASSLLGRTDWDWGTDPLEPFSLEARRKIREVDRKYRREFNELQQRRWTGELSLEDMARLRELEREKRAALAAVLSAAALEEYTYRQSAAADYVRRTLPEANSEDEFRTMVRLAWEMEMSESGDPLSSRSGIALPDDAKREVEQRKAEFDKRLKELLGETRIAEQTAEEEVREEAARQQQRAQDEQRVQRELNAMAAEVGVSADDAARFYKRIKELEPTLRPKFEAMEQSLTGTPEEKAKQMGNAVRAEMEKIAVEIMGEKGRTFVEKITKSGGQ
jgi:hypothetical protein